MEPVLYTIYSSIADGATPKPDDVYTSNSVVAMGFTVLGCFLNALSLILMKYSMET